MKILVLGAGVVGVTTAHALGQQGHEVTVIDKESSVAGGASHANGGQLSYSYVDPFPNPGILKKLPGYILGRDSGIKVNPTLRLSYYLWGLQFLKNCTTESAKNNMSTMLGLAHHSMKAMQKLSLEMPSISGSENDSGKIILAKTETDLKLFTKSAKEKREHGFEIEVLNRQDCLKKEPKLEAWQGKFCGGTFTTNDSTIDPTILCSLLKQNSVKKYGVSYKFDHTIKSLISRKNKITGIVTDQGSFDCDAVVICLGIGTNNILKTVGLGSNIYPMRGYSLTLPCGENTPQMSITDPLNKLVFANLGDKVRIAGFLDANLSEQKIKTRGKMLLETAKRLWPDAADYNADDHLWAGYRPMTPSGVPIVDESPVKGLYYNMGHGSLGLTLAAGSAERIAKLIGRSKPKTHLIKLEKDHALAS